MYLKSCLWLLLASDRKLKINSLRQKRKIIATEMKGRASTRHGLTQDPNDITSHLSLDLRF